jgi:ABC-type phosphate/phosphonate transport system substrate-binding protein
MIAALGMYDRPETAAANDALWAGIRDSLRAQGLSAPQGLTRGDLAYMQGWLSPDLVFSQTCSLPYRAKLASHVQMIATPDYGLEGCPVGHYRSVYVARQADGFDTLDNVAGLDFAYNEGLSHSGWAAPYFDHSLRGLQIRPSLRTGAHRESAQAVAEGRADYAAIDALTWKMICTFDDFASKLAVIGHTPASPALPFITAKTNDVESLRKALSEAIAALHPDHRAALHLRGCVTIPASAYLNLDIPPTPMAR